MKHKSDDYKLNAVDYYLMFNGVKPLRTLVECRPKNK